MDHDYAQRRRVALAIAVTAIAGPAAFLLNRGNDDPTPADPAAVVTVVPTLPGQPTVAAVADQAAAGDPLGTAPIGYLTGSTLPEQLDPARIAIPQLPVSVKGVATFSSEIDSTTRCQAKLSNGIPFNATLTVTNLDNSRSIQCVASVGGPEPATDIVLASATFAEIADLTDAPVPVQITWADQ